MTTRSNGHSELSLPFKGVANFVVAVVLFLLVALVVLFGIEYWQLSTVEGNGGYPFGVEEAGPEYATKEVYLRHSRRVLMTTGILTSIMVLGLLWKKVWLTRSACIVALILGSLQFFFGR